MAHSLVMKYCARIRKENEEIVYGFLSAIYQTVAAPFFLSLLRSDQEDNNLSAKSCLEMLPRETKTRWIRVETFLE